MPRPLGARSAASTRMPARLALSCCLGLLACGSPGAQPDGGASLDAALADAVVADAVVADAVVADAFVADAGEEPLALATYLDHFFEDLCGWFVRCEPKIGALALGQTLCHPLRRDETRAGFEALVASGEARFDPALARACLDGLHAAECDPATLDLDRCDAAFVGQVALGAPCRHDLGCADGRCIFGESCPGTCMARGAGQSCGSHADCEGELACVESTCGPRRGVGERCVRRTDCELPLTCRLDGTCGDAPAEGALCRVSLGGDLCHGDLVCADDGGGTRVCSVGVAPGEVCSTSYGCAPGGRCVEGTCVATAAPQADCRSSAQCAWLHVCVDGACVPMPTATLGGACDDERPCVEGSCVDGACALLAPGAVCDDEVQFGECAGTCRRGVCEAPLAEGAECAGGATCATGLECRESGRGPRCLPRCGA